MVSLKSYTDFEKAFDGRMHVTFDTTSVVHIKGVGTARRLFISSLYLQTLVPLCTVYDDDTINFTATSYEFQELHRHIETTLFYMGLFLTRLGPTRTQLSSGGGEAEYYQGLRYHLPSGSFINPLPPLFKTADKDMLNQFRQDCDVYALKLATYRKLTGNSSEPVVLTFNGKHIRSGNIATDCKGVPTEQVIKKYIRLNSTSLKRDYGVFDGRR